MKVGCFMPVAENELQKGPETPSRFVEALAWKEVAEGWCPLFGNMHELGYNFDWHDFQQDKELDWAKSFHPGSIELCINLCGEALLNDGRQTLKLGARHLAFYHPGNSPLTARRAACDRHQFLTVEYAPQFLARHFGGQTTDLHPLVRDLLQGRKCPSQCETIPGFGVEMMQFVESLRRPPVFAPAQRVWFSCKALELAAQLFFLPSAGELFCTRTRRVGRERVERAQALLRERMSDPPSLEDLARQVGCSHYYLSRLFSQEMGMTIQQYLRQIRLERAAELLRTGQCNVTEAALEVGYNSLSHFSTAFHSAFGCCPGLYPLSTLNK